MNPLDLMRRWRSRGAIGVAAETTTGRARPLALRFVFILVPTIFVVNLVSAALIGLHDARIVAADLNAKQSELLTTRARLIAEPLWNFRYEIVQAALSDLSKDPDVLGVKVQDESGAVVVEFGSVGGDAGASLSQPIGYTNGNTEARIGTITITFDSHRADLQIRDRTLESVLLSLLSGAAVLVCVLFVIRMVVLKPLAELSRAIMLSRTEHRRFKAELKADDEIGALVCTFNAMQEQLEQEETIRRKFNAELERLSQTDALTGKLNRAGFFGAARQRLESFREGGSAAAGLIAFIDLDRFKIINDSYGHTVGDRYIAAVAGRLDATFRDRGFVGRIGGDELAVFIDDRAGPLDKQAVVADFARCLRDPIAIDSLVLDCSASIGLAAYPDDGGELNALLTAADHAMYRAKSEGGDRCIVHNAEIAGQMSLRQNIACHVRDGLRNGWFGIAVQPIVDIATLRPVGAEVLARLHHPQHGDIPPAVFIPVAEASGQISAIGRFVIGKALEALPELQAISRNERFYLSVNVAAMQLTEQLPEDLTASLARSGANVNSLVLEITENAIVGQGPRYDTIIAKLKRLGFRFALDDFGTGQSPISYFDRFDIDFIKIDRSFIQVDPNSRERQDIRRRGMLQAMVALGRELSIPVIAEGIETDQQLAVAREVGIGLGQGYLFSRPLPVPALQSWLGLFADGGGDVVEATQWKARSAG